MNRVSGHISSIQTNGSLSMVAVTIAEDCILRAVVIETPETADYLRKGQAIEMLFKETEVIIGTSKTAEISLQNKIPAIVSAIERGTLLSKLSLETRAGVLRALISSEMLDELDLKERSEVLAMIKLNEVMLSAL